MSPQDDIEKLRTAYDAFLAEYPLCYGYWKKYADAEARHQNSDMVGTVYERGVAATPYSAELWVHYAAFQKGLPDATHDDVRRCGCVSAGATRTRPAWTAYIRRVV